MSKVSELNKLAEKITGESPKENTIREILDSISSFYKGSKVKSSNTEKAIKNVTENYTSGGSGYPPDWSEIGYEDTPTAIIDGFNTAKTIYDNWDNTQTNFDLRTYTNLVAVPLVDTSNITYMSQGCEGLVNLMAIPLLDTENVTNISKLFYGCSALTDVPVLATGNLVSYGFSSAFKNCYSLSDNSLNNIMQMCINATGVTSGFNTLQQVGLSSGQATRCQSLSNYADFIAAGWTTGY